MHVVAELPERDGVKEVNIIHRRPCEVIIQLEWYAAYIVLV